MPKNESRDNFLYFDITKKERDSAIRYLLGAVINSRRESGFPSNEQVFDEDVNIYLAHLLFAVSLPEYHEMAEPYLSMSTSDVLRWVRATEDRTIRYFIFKVNADHILVHSGIFDDLTQERGHKIFQRPDKHFTELARLYYEQAAAYHKRIYRKSTGVGDVLMKLSQQYENYVKALKLLRRDYFHFLTDFRDQVFKNFMFEFNAYESQVQKKSKTDLFLDLYARWLNSKDPELLPRIRQVVGELKGLDPSFKFNMDRDLNPKGCGDEEKCA